jgi:hypothetical protein
MYTNNVLIFHTYLFLLVFLTDIIAVLTEDGGTERPLHNVFIWRAHRLPGEDIIFLTERSVNFTVHSCFIQCYDSVVIEEPVVKPFRLQSDLWDHKSSPSAKAGVPWSHHEIYLCSPNCIPYRGQLKYTNDLLNNNSTPIVTSSNRVNIEYNIFSKTNGKIMICSAVIHYRKVTFLKDFLDHYTSLDVDIMAMYITDSYLYSDLLEKYDRVDRVIWQNQNKSQLVRQYGQTMAYMDCLYRYRHYEWILFVDPDDILVLGNDTLTLPLYISKIESDGKKPTHIAFKWLRHNLSVQNSNEHNLLKRYPQFDSKPTRLNYKMMLQPSKYLAIGIHRPQIKMRNVSVKSYSPKVAEAYMAHFKQKIIY